VTVDTLRMGLVHKRMRFKNQRSCAKVTLDLWRDETVLSMKLMQLNSRVLFMTDRRLLQQCFRAWQNEAANIAFVRSATSGGMMCGTKFAAQAKLKGFRAWFNHSRENCRQEAAMMRVCDKMCVVAAYRMWNEHAIAWKRKTEKFGRLIFAFEMQIIKTAWHGWVNVHAKTVIRANKLMNLMWKWDRSRTLRTWSQWCDWIVHRTHVTSLSDRNVALYLVHTLKSLLYSHSPRKVLVAS